MKKFYFALDTVLRYKEQVLDGLKAEHARILAKVRECEQAIEELELLHRQCTDEFRQSKMELRFEKFIHMRIIWNLWGFRLDGRKNSSSSFARKKKTKGMK